MGAWSQALQSITTGGSQTIVTASFIIGGIILGFGLVAVLFTWWFVKKRWNLRVEFKLSRSDGKLTVAEWGKGMFNAKRGVVFVKRPGLRQKAVPMKIFDIRKYIQGDNIISVIQVGSSDYRPILNNSWEEYWDELKDEEGNLILDKDGKPTYEKASVLNIRVDSKEDKAWQSAFDAASKKAYSLSSFFQQFQTPIAVAIVILAVFVGFAILWARMGTMCG